MKAITLQSISIAVLSGLLSVNAIAGKPGDTLTPSELAAHAGIV
jgi:hypothetical protein